MLLEPLDLLLHLLNDLPSLPHLVHQDWASVTLRPLTLLHHLVLVCFNCILVVGVLISHSFVNILFGFSFDGILFIFSFVDILIRGF